MTCSYFTACCELIWSSDVGEKHAEHDYHHQQQHDKDATVYFEASFRSRKLCINGSATASAE